MRIGTYGVDGDERLGLVTGDGVVDLLAASDGQACFHSLLDWLAAGPEAFERAQNLGGSRCRLPEDARLLAPLSAGFPLRPGDVIATGTGAGCAFSFDPPRFLRAGQLVELWAEGVGRLANPVGE